MKIFTLAPIPVCATIYCVFGLILLQLLQSCDYSKSRDALWMKKKFENNAELFFDVTNLFNNSIPINLKKENYVNFNDKNNSVDIIIQ